MIKYFNKYGEELRYMPFIELQWNRKYYECGSFVLYMAEQDYDPNIKYIQNIGSPKNRPETGIVQKVLREQKTEGVFYTLSGFFIEKIADGGAYSRSQTANVSGTNVKSSLTAPIWRCLEEKKNCYKRSVSDDSVYPDAISYSINEMVPLGTALYEVLELGAPDYSYSCNPIFAPKGNESTSPLLGIDFIFKKGRDLRNKVYFGTAWSDVSNITYTFDDSAAKPTYICVQKISETSDITAWNVFYAIEEIVNKDGTVERRGKLKYTYDSNRPQNMGAYYPFKILKTEITDVELIPANQTEIARLMTEAAKLDMLNNYKVETISADVLQNRFKYLEDYDLGDVCSVVIDELEQMYTARIVEVYEVHSKNKVDIQIVMGTPQKQKYRRIIQ